MRLVPRLQLRDNTLYPLYDMSRRFIMSSSLARVDERGRLVIPSRVKKRLKIGSTVRLREKNGRLEVIPVLDPLKNLEGSAKARITAKALDELAESIIARESFR